MSCCPIHWITNGAGEQVATPDITCAVCVGLAVAELESAGEQRHWDAPSISQQEYVLALHAKLEKATKQRDEAEGRIDKLRFLIAFGTSVSIDDVVRVLDGGE